MNLRTVVCVCALVVSGGSSIASAQKKSADEWIQQLDAEDEAARKQAVAALSKLGKRARKELEGALGSNQTSPRARVGLIRVLGGMGRNGLRILDPLLTRPATNVTFATKPATVFAIGEVGREAAWTAPLLLELAGSKDPAFMRTGALRVFGVVSPDTKKNRSVLERFIGGDDRELALAGALGHWYMCGEAEFSLPLLLAGLDERDDRDVLESAIYSLGEMGAAAAGAEPALLELYEDDILPRTMSTIETALKKLEGKQQPDYPREQPAD